MSTTGRRGRPAATDEPAIVSAALDVLDAGGMEAFTVRAVAERLGVGHATVLRHVESRDRLIELVLAALQARLPAELVREAHTITTWKDGVLLWARATHRQAAAHPGAVAILARIRFVPDTPETRDLLERLTLLAEADGVALEQLRAMLATVTQVALGMGALHAVRSREPAADNLERDIAKLEGTHPAAARMLRATGALHVDALAAVVDALALVAVAEVAR